MFRTMAVASTQPICRWITLESKSWANGRRGSAAREGRSFKDMAAETGVSINTLLSRKRYAVLHLRERLRSLYDEFMNR